MRRARARRRTGIKMEDEEVAESWEEAADSGVRAAARGGAAGPGGRGQAARRCLRRWRDASGGAATPRRC